MTSFVFICVCVCVCACVCVYACICVHVEGWVRLVYGEYTTQTKWAETSACVNLEVVCVNFEEYVRD